MRKGWKMAYGSTQLENLKFGNKVKGAQIGKGFVEDAIA
jgi:hypothetical protein